VLAVLCVVPRPWVARAKLLPQDLNSAGLGQILSQLGGQLGTFASLIGGGRPPNDLYLVIGRSDPVLTDVIDKLKLAGEGRQYATMNKAKVAVRKKVDIRMLLGGVVEVQARTRDPDEAQRLTSAFVQSISRHIGQIGRLTTQRKRDVVAQRLNETRVRLAQADGALDAFRRQNRIAGAEQQLGSELSLRAQLQARLQASLVERQTLQQVSGPENVRLQQIDREIAALRAQIASAAAPRVGSAGPSVGGLSELQTRYLNLYQEAQLQRALYEAYSRATEQTAVETLVTESSTFIQLVEGTHLDPDRKYNMPALGALATLILLALFTEWYAPATGLRWPRRNGIADES
jgi:capsule polysaccharide export protein KpsE/RkpR